MDTSESRAHAHVQRLLMARSEVLREYVRARIPQRFCAVVGADDVLQDVWIRAFRSYSAEVRDVDAWLFRIAQSQLIDALRTARAMRRGGDHTQSPSDSLSVMWTRVLARQRTPSREVSAGETSDAIHLALCGLSEERRRAIRMRYIEGRERHEIASEMQKSEAAVNSLLFQGLRQLRMMLGEAVRYYSDVRTSSGEAATRSASG